MRPTSAPGATPGRITGNRITRGRIAVRIAIVSTIVPNTLRTGSEIATLALVQTLQALGHGVTVYAYARTVLPLAAAMPAVALATIPITTAEAPLGHKLLWLGRSLRSGLPISSEKFNYVPPDRIAAAVAAAGADLVIADHVNLYPFLRPLARRLPIGVVFHDIQAVSYAMVAQQARRPWWRAVYRREARLNAVLEQEAGEAAAFSWFLSEADAAVARTRFGNRRAYAVPLFYPFEHGPSQPVDARHDVGLIGTWSWPPVAEGMRWFLAEVLPRLPDDVTVAVAGLGSEALPSGRIRRLGVVPDARLFLAGCRVAAVPAVAGTGLQIKTLELAALGMPAVSTRLGVRGLEDLPPTLAVADDASAFAAALVALLRPQRATQAQGSAASASWNDRRRATAKEVVRASLADLPRGSMEPHGTPPRSEEGAAVVPAG